MFRLTRQVRFGLTPTGGPGGSQPPTNGHAGFPRLEGLGHFFALDVTLAGQLERESQYLLNIKRIDERVRAEGVAVVQRAVGGGFAGGGRVVRGVFEALRDGWPGDAVLEGVRLGLSPYLAVEVLAREYPMVRLSQRFEFSAAHRLHNAALSAEENQRTFGKCNNPHGHGHNYELQVTVVGEPDGDGVIVPVGELERIVHGSVISRVDHKHLNLEVAEFRERIPSVENIARVIFGWLAPQFAGATRLASVTVWETPKTWCEYSE